VKTRLLVLKKLGFKKIFANQEKLGEKLGCYEFIRDIEPNILSFVEKNTKKVKFVASWIIEEFDIDSAEQEHLDNNHLSNFIVSANAVIDGRYTADSFSDFSISSYLKSFRLNCIFETKNTLYVLCGGPHSKK